jgi:hypothetical protein
VSVYKAGSPVTILQKHGYKKRSGWATYARTFAKSLIASFRDIPSGRAATGNKRAERDLIAKILPESDPVYDLTTIDIWCVVPAAGVPPECDDGRQLAKTIKH